MALLIVGGIIVACAAILSLVVFNWSMTGHFVGAPSDFLLPMMAATFAFSFVGTVLVFASHKLLQRFGLHQPWIELGLGGLLFWALTSAMAFNLWTGLVAIPCGVVAAFIVSRRDGKLLGWPGRIVVLCGVLACGGLLLQPMIEARQAKKWEQQRAGRSVLGDRIMGGIVFRSAIWLYNGDGKTASFDLRTLNPTIRASRGVVALQPDASGIWALVAPSLDWRSDHQPAARFRLARYQGADWQYSPWMNYGVDERPLALAVGRDGPIVLGPKRLYLFKGQVLSKAVPLSIRVDVMGQFVTEVVGNTMYLGLNRGEWGGGLLAIDLSSGNVAQVDRRETKELCAGPLNGDCDPVTGLVADVAHPGCIFASVGLAHFMWEGRVLRVCGNRVETVFKAEVLPIGKRIERLLSRRARRYPPETEPVFGLAPAKEGFWAVTPRALYRWTPTGVDRLSFPKLQPVHGLAISRSLPGLLVLSTDANAAMSLSGYTPLLFDVPSPQPNG